MALTEMGHAGGFILRDSPRSRDNVIVASGQNLKAGQVVARINKGVGGMAIPTVVGTGNGTMTALYAGPDIESGNYVVKCKTAAANGGVFSVTSPSGKILPDATVGTPYRSRHLNFLLNDGSADFVVNDTFTVAVAAGTSATIRPTGSANGTLTGITIGPDAMPGQYRFECIAAVTNGGTFKVVGPDGSTLNTGSIVAGAGGTWAVADSRVINFTITDGSTDFAVGDAFEVAVFNVTTGKVTAWDPSAVSGADDAAGILYDDVDASGGDKMGAIVARDAEILTQELYWPATVPTGNQASALAMLAARGIIAR